MKKERIWWKVILGFILFEAFHWLIISALVQAICWCFGYHCTLRFATGVWLVTYLIKYCVTPNGGRK